MTNVSEKLFVRVEERRLAGEGRIRLVDGGASSQPLTDSQLQILRAQRPEDLQKLGVSIEFCDNGTTIEARLKSGSLVGAARYVFRANTLDVVIEPKIGAAPLFSMLSVCSQRPVQLGGEVALAHEKREITDIILEYALENIYAFLRRNYYRDYTIKNDCDAQRIRGRVLIRDFIQNNLPRFRLHRAPCEFFDYSPDTVENRVVLAALTTAGRLLSILPKTTRQGLSRKIALCRSYLAEVSEVSFTERDLAALRYHPQNKQFQLIHDVCRLILNNTSVTLQPGQRLTFMCFTVNMNRLFEEYVRQSFYLAFRDNVMLSQKKREFKIQGIKKNIIVDLLLRKGSDVAVGDCKNKLVTRIDAIEFTEADIKHADIYQVIAYTGHEMILARSAFLVYPIALEGQPPLKMVGETTSFYGSDGKAVPVRFFLLNLLSVNAELVDSLRQHSPYFFPSI